MWTRSLAQSVALLVLACTSRSPHVIDDPDGRTTGSSGSGGAGGEASGSAGAAGEGESNAALPGCDEADDTDCDDGEG